jgi:uncharacterized protein YkwD
MAYAKHAGVVVVAVVLAVAAAVGLSASNPSTAEAALVTVKTCGGGSIDLTGTEKRTLDLHNQARASNGLPALCVQPTLTKAARAHSQEMLDKDYFSHDSYDGETFGARLKRFGYTSSGYGYYTVGENIAWGSGSYGSPDAVFKGWMNSAGHKANILNPKFREIGIGARTGTYKTYAGATMYTVDFGARR